MQIQMLSKRYQAAYVKELEEKIAEYDKQIKDLAPGADPPKLDDDAKLLKEEGIVRE